MEANLSWEAEEDSNSTTSQPNVFEVHFNIILPCT
jgi:hypothetical protein